MDVGSFFSGDYYQAKEKFKKAALAKGGEIHTYHHSTSGSGEGDITTDVAYLGPKNPKKLLVTISGTHGNEGFYGSACQSAYLDSYYSKRDDLALLFIHAINPYGFARGHREDECNIDLNRNFVDHRKEYPTNKTYDDLADYLIPKQWEGEEKIKADAALRSYKRQGKQYFAEAILFGQYKYPKGLFFGGNDISWSNATLNKILDTFVVGVSTVAVVDFHTGYGSFANTDMYCLRSKSTASFQRMKEWYQDVINVIVSPYAIAGSQAYYIEKKLFPTEVVCGVIECGTTNEVFDKGMIPSALEALRLDRWLQIYGDPESSQGKEMKRWIREMVYPSDMVWRKKTLFAALQVLNRAAEEL